MKYKVVKNLLMVYFNKGTIAQHNQTSAQTMETMRKQLLYSGPIFFKVKYNPGGVVQYNAYTYKNITYDTYLHYKDIDE